MNVPDRLAMGLAALFVVVGLVFAIGSWGAYLTDTQIAREGGRATGTITDKSVSRGDDDTDYLLRYRFTLPDGRWQTGQHGIASALTFEACVEVEAMGGRIASHGGRLSVEGADAAGTDADASGEGPDGA